VITDCCDSGGMLDHVSVVIGGNKEDGRKNRLREIKAATRKSAARNLPTTIIAKIFSAKPGRKAEPISNGINDTLANIFGRDVGKSMMMFAVCQTSNGSSNVSRNPITPLMSTVDGEGAG
jgi:hypothetical protein